MNVIPAPPPFSASPARFASPAPSPFTPSTSAPSPSAPSPSATSPEIALDRAVLAGCAHFPVRIRHGDGSWAELPRVADALGAEEFLLVSERGVPRAHIARVLRHLGAHAPTRLSWSAGGGVPEGVRVAPGSVVVALGGTRVIEAAADLAGRGHGDSGHGENGHRGRGGRPRLVLMPTTPRAMADTALSLVDADGRPRTAPVLVRAQLEFLRTLPSTKVRDGLAPLVRNVLAVRPGSYDSVAARLRPGGDHDPGVLASFLVLCAECRATAVCYDPFEQGPARALSYGRTVADALRAEAGGTLPAGAAAALGMLVAARVAVEAGLLDPAAERAHRDLIARWGAPLRLPVPLSAERVVERVIAGPGGGAMVLLDDLGRPHMGRDGMLTATGRPLLRAGLAAVAAAVPSAGHAEAARLSGVRAPAVPVGVPPTVMRHPARASGPGRP
ncbi:3-dehydroquinate synthase family protein [Streptomyces albireticuli]|nr:hypothetical protein [Streptomyces albireticuli]MCD9145056.1 hypothetical protein [Streptomyces albireticuli]MCD9164482.1 hypothetical protein [Streptomyces albireticuli]MCD9194193.1 hypothetical protein [Streptomyces albireticuli]